MIHKVRMKTEPCETSQVTCLLTDNLSKFFFIQTIKVTTIELNIILRIEAVQTKMKEKFLTVVHLHLIKVTNNFRILNT